MIPGPIRGPVRSVALGMALVWSAATCSDSGPAPSQGVQESAIPPVADGPRPDGKEWHWFLKEPSLDPQVYDELWDHLPVLSFELFRGGGQGNHRVYKAWLSVEGRAAYRGIDNVTKLDNHQAEVRLWDYGRLCRAFQQLRIQELAGEYSIPVTHQDKTELRVRLRGGEEVVISDWGHQTPIEFWAFCASIDHVLDGLIWEPVYE
jgi:hypothetical protein